MIAIIPAKGHSDAIPHKNMEDLGGMPLFWHSVRYARAEGVEPIVSTDDPEIKCYAQQRGCRVVNEVVDDSSMINCVRQVFDQVDTQRYAILQPTSPLRHPGLLERMAGMNAPCAFTAQRIKIVGRMGNKMVVQGRRQDASDMLLQFDGSILTGTRQMAEQGCLFAPDAVPVEQRIPYTLQVDHPEDLNIIRQLYEHFHCWK